MRYFLDTNIIIILFEGREKEIKRNIFELLLDDRNDFYMSSISLLEMAQLYRKKRFKDVDYLVYDTGDKFLAYLLQFVPMVKVLPFEEKHAFIAGRLNFVPKHNDPNDLAIIAHAIVEGMTIISCDDKFSLYEGQGTKVIHNPR